MKQLKGFERFLAENETPDRELRDLGLASREKLEGSFEIAGTFADYFSNDAEIQKHIAAIHARIEAIIPEFLRDYEIDSQELEEAIQSMSDWAADNRERNLEEEIDIIAAMKILDDEL